MDGLVWMSYFDSDWHSEGAKQKEVSDLERRGGSHEALSSGVNRRGLCRPLDFGAAQEVLNDIHQKPEPQRSSFTPQCSKIDRGLRHMKTLPLCNFFPQWPLWLGHWNQMGFE